MTIIKTWLKKPLFIFSFIGVIATISIALIGNWMGLTRADWPGWVQAFGSIGAILVAVHVSRASVISEVWRNNQSIIAVAQTAQQYSENMRAIFCKEEESFPGYIPEEFINAYSPRLLTSVIDSLGAIPVLAPGNAKGVRQLLNLRESMLEFSDSLQAAANYSDIFTHKNYRVRYETTRIKADCDEIMKIVKALEEALT